jgi:flagellar basal-body rod protein FlgC
MAFLSSLNISGSALTAQKLRMQVTAQNIANANTTVTDDGGVYKRKSVVLAERRIPSDFKSNINSAEEEINSFGGVMAVSINEDETGSVRKYDPDNPEADGDGYVQQPGIDTTEEMIEMIAASRAYESNITVFNAVKSMASKALEIGK